MTLRTLGLGALGFLALGLASVGCENATEPDTQPTAQLTIEPFADPQISYDPTRGTTTVIVRFVARRGAVPLGESDLTTELYIDGDPIDVESLLQQDSESLSANLHLTLVLDTSYSMLQHSTPAFAPMLSAARRALGAGSGLYTQRPGIFEWDLVWFDDAIYRPIAPTQLMRWTPQDVERIPPPLPGSFTKLHAALKDALQTSIAHAQQFGSGPRDQHLVVAFSDGADNYSWFDNSALSGQGSLDLNRQFRYFGSDPVTRPEVETLLKQHPEVQLHVMGLGSAVNDDDLISLSKAGRGRYFKNLDPTKVDQLFEKVILEFTSVQTHGAEIPLPPGEYSFRVKVKAPGAAGSYSFRFVAGVNKTEVLP